MKYFWNAMFLFLRKCNDRWTLKQGFSINSFLEEWYISQVRKYVWLCVWGGGEGKDFLLVFYLVFQIFLLFFVGFLLNNYRAGCGKFLFKYVFMDTFCLPLVLYGKLMNVKSLFNIWWYFWVQFNFFLLKKNPKLYLLFSNLM